MKYELVEPFDIDDGELDGLSPQECFTLGVEWQAVRANLESGDDFTWTVHAENRGRLQAMMERNGRPVRFTFMEDDVSESWLNMEVGPSLHEGKQPAAEDG